MRISVAFVAAAALFATPVLAGQDSEPEARAEEPAPEAKEDKKVCRQVSQVGSRKRERICLTREEWLKVNRGE